MKITRKSLHELKDTINRLRNQCPIGIKKLDDERDAKIERLNAMVADAVVIEDCRIDHRVAFPSEGGDK